MYQNYSNSIEIKTLLVFKRRPAFKSVSDHIFLRYSPQIQIAGDLP